jgi:hypothetical protein
MGIKIDLAGKRVGRLTVLWRGSQDQNKRFKWVCKCDCGNLKELHGRHLKNEKVKTCGCGIGIERHKPFLGKTGPLHPKWKGGQHVTQDGYIMRYVAPGKYVFEHRLVAGVKNSKEVVHHKNHDKQDNRPENLQVMDRSEHAKEHGLGVTCGSGNREAARYIEREIQKRKANG